MQLLRSSLGQVEKLYLIILTSVFLVTRALAFAVGLRYLTGETVWFIQILDLDVLRDHLLRALLHLHAQPPLFNLLIGLTEKLGGVNFGNWMLGIQLSLGLASTLAVFITLTLLDVPASVCFYVSLAIMLNPAAILYEFDPLYTEIVYAIHCFIAVVLAYFIRSRSRPALYGLAGLLVLLTLVRASYQWLWIVLVFAMLSFLLENQRKLILQVGLAAAGIACLWPAKNYILFRHFTSSTWGSYSLSKHWDGLSRPPMMQQWIATGALRTFAPSGQTAESAARRQQANWPASRTGLPELDDVMKQRGGATNWNSISMLKMHDEGEHDDLFLLRHDWKHYVINALHAVRDYFEPSSAYFMAFAGDPQWRESVAQYRKLQKADETVRRICCNVFGFANISPNGTYAVPRSHLRVAMDNLQSLCLGAVLSYGLLLGCLFSFHRSRYWAGHENGRSTAAVVLVTIAYSFALVSLLEVGENMRYRYETQPLVTIVVTLFLYQTWLKYKAFRSTGRLS